MENINAVIKGYFVKNKIKLKDVSILLNISQSNLSERLQSNRSITLDQFFTLYKNYGDGFAIAVMQHYNSRMLFIERIQHLIKITHDLKEMYHIISHKNNMAYDILEEINQGINGFSKIDTALE